jgi:hypothetical protein
VKGKLSALSFQPNPLRAFLTTFAVQQPELKREGLEVDARDAKALKLKAEC